MTTTAIFVEILIAGVQSMIWIALLILAVFGSGWLPDPGKFEHLGPIMILVAFGVSYSFGIVNDRMARTFFHLAIPERLIGWVGSLPERIWATEDVDPPHDNARMEVLIAEGKATEFLDFIRSRTRLARATFFNTLLSVICGCALIILRPEVIWQAPSATAQWETGIIIVVLGSAILVASFLSYTMLNHNYELRRTQARNAYERRKPPA